MIRVSSSEVTVSEEEEGGKLTITSSSGGIFRLAHYEEEIGPKGFGTMLLIKSRRPLPPRGLDIYKEIGGIRSKIESAQALEDEELKKEKEAHLLELKSLFNEIAPIIYVEEIPNQYCGLSCCFNTPWAVVTTQIGHIQIGWRKRVINIDWTKTLVKASGKAIFPMEEVTRSESYESVRYVHAWGYEKATEYLKKLHDPELLK